MAASSVAPGSQCPLLDIGVFSADEGFQALGLPAKTGNTYSQAGRRSINAATLTFCTNFLILYGTKCNSRTFFTHETFRREETETSANLRHHFIVDLVLRQTLMFDHHLRAVEILR